MRGRTRHLDERVLALVAGGDLGRLARWRADRHIASCDRCRSGVAAYSTTREALAAEWTVPEADFGAIAHRARAAAAYAPAASRYRRRRWLLAAAVGLVAWMLLPNLEDQSNQPPELASRPPEAASAALLGLDGSAAQIGDRGQLSVRAYHAPSGTLSITEYYAP